MVFFTLFPGSWLVRLLFNPHSPIPHSLPPPTPDSFATNNFFYIYWRPNLTQRFRVSRFTYRATASVLLTSEKIIYEDPLVSVSPMIHRGGGMVFGDEGALYLPQGDWHQPALAQDLSSRAGKVLRMSASTGQPWPGNYGLSDGPGGAIDDYIYSYGHRNPYSVTKYQGKIYAFEVWEGGGLGRKGVK